MKLHTHTNLTRLRRRSPLTHLCSVTI